MNFEICERCKKGKISSLSVYPFQYNLLRMTFDIAEESNKKDEDYCCVKVAFYIPEVIGLDVKERLKKIKLSDERCPFYLEHCLYDWNNEK